MFQRSTSIPSRLSSVKLVTLQTSAEMLKSFSSSSAAADHLPQDRTTTQQLHPFAPLATQLEAVDATADARFDTFWHRRLQVVSRSITVR